MEKNCVYFLHYNTVCYGEIIKTTKEGFSTIHEIEYMNGSKKEVAKHVDQCFCYEELGDLTVDFCSQGNASYKEFISK